MVKLYGMFWLVLAVVGLVLALAGLMTMPVMVLFGFVLFGMIFMGMIAVLPTMVSDHSLDPSPSKPVKVNARHSDRKLERPIRSVHA